MLYYEASYISVPAKFDFFSCGSGLTSNENFLNFVLAIAIYTKVLSRLSHGALNGVVTKT